MSVFPSPASDPIPSLPSFLQVPGSATSHSLDGYCASRVATRLGLSPGSINRIGAAPIPAARFLQSPSPLTGFIAGRQTTRPASCYLRQHQRLNLRPAPSALQLSSLVHPSVRWGEASSWNQSDTPPVSYSAPGAQARPLTAHWFLRGLWNTRRRRTLLSVDWLGGRPPPPGWERGGAGRGAERYLLKAATTLWGCWKAVLSRGRIRSGTRVGNFVCSFKLFFKGMMGSIDLEHLVKTHHIL